MLEAALQPFVTSQRQTGVAGRATTTGLAQVWTWQASPNAAIEAGPTATSATKLGRRPFNQQNKLGSYHCWNRTYDLFMGRWTTPDPAATPWGNLWDYVGGNGARSKDSTGLNPVAVPAAGFAAVAEACLIGAAVGLGLELAVQGIFRQRLANKCELLIAAVMGCLTGGIGARAGVGILKVSTWASVEKAATQMKITIPGALSSLALKLGCVDPVAPVEVPPELPLDGLKKAARETTVPVTGMANDGELKKWVVPDGEPYGGRVNGKCAVDAPWFDPEQWEAPEGAVRDQHYDLCIESCVAAAKHWKRWIHDLKKYNPGKDGVGRVFHKRTNAEEVAGECKEKCKKFEIRHELHGPKPR